MDQDTSSTTGHSQGAIPQPDPQYVKRMKRVVIILGILMVAGMMALVAGLIFKSGKNKTIVVKKSFKLETILPANSTIVSTSTDGDRLTVHTRSKAGNQIIIYNVRKGIEIGRITLK